MSDERLLRNAARGNTDALTSLIETLAPTVFIYLRGMLGDGPESDEAFQETFVRLARSAGRYERGTDVTAWALQIARRVAAEASVETVAPGPWSPERGRQWARQSLSAMSVADRELVVFRELVGWDADAIAQNLEMTVPEVRSRIAAAREALLRGFMGAPEGVQ